MARPTEPDPPQPKVYELEVPMLRSPHRRGEQTSLRVGPPLTANMRLDWGRRAARTSRIREGVGWAAKAVRIGRQDHIVVRLHYRVSDAIRRDPSNLMPTQKAAVDGLVDAGIVPDDTPDYVTEEMPIIHTEPGPRRLWLTVTTEE